MTEGIHLERVMIRLKGTTLIDIEARVPPGKVLTVMGPSGSGKSSLLSFLTGTLPAAFEAEGRIWLAGRDLTSRPTHERNLGILFQDDLLFPHLSVAGNLGFGLRPGPRGERRRRIAAALAEVGLEGFDRRDPATLSGGQRARVALMRTLLAEPDALLLDEPFSRLDEALRDQTREMTFRTARARGLPVILVTHDLEDAAAAGGQLISLGD